MENLFITLFLGDAEILLISLSFTSLAVLSASHSSLHVHTR